MSRTFNNREVRPAHIALDDDIEHTAILTARECGRCQPGKLASAMGWHPSNGSRAMNGDATGGRAIARALGTAARLHTYPQTTAWPMVARMRTLLMRIDLYETPVSELIADFWRHLDAEAEAAREAMEARERKDGRAFLEAEERRLDEGTAVAARLGVLIKRHGIDPLSEGRSP